jgi:hypothetical protein
VKRLLYACIATLHVLPANPDRHPFRIRTRPLEPGASDRSRRNPAAAFRRVPPDALIFVSRKIAGNRVTIELHADD